MLDEGYVRNPADRSSPSQAGIRAFALSLDGWLLLGRWPNGISVSGCRSFGQLEGRAADARSAGGDLLIGNNMGTAGQRCDRFWLSDAASPECHQRLADAEADREMARSADLQRQIDDNQRRIDATQRNTDAADRALVDLQAARPWPDPANPHRGTIVASLNARCHNFKLR